MLGWSWNQWNMRFLLAAPSAHMTYLYWIYPTDPQVQLGTWACSLLLPVWKLPEAEDSLSMGLSAAQTNLEVLLFDEMTCVFLKPPHICPRFGPWKHKEQIWYFFQRIVPPQIHGGWSSLNLLLGCLKLSSMLPIILHFLSPLMILTSLH